MDGEGEDDQEKKYMEKASRERNAKGWFKKRECTRSKKMERRCPVGCFTFSPF